MLLSGVVVAVEAPALVRVPEFVVEAEVVPLLAVVPAAGVDDDLSSEVEEALGMAELPVVGVAVVAATVLW